MARITARVLSQLPDAPALLDFIARHRYKPENAALLDSPTFAFLPDYAQYVIWILDFETEYEMQGLLTLLENALGQHLPAIARSFEQTHNAAIAQCLQQLVAVLAAANSQLAAELGNASPAIPPGLRNNNLLLTHLERIDDCLRPLILAKEYWDKAVAFVQFRLEQP
jgi:hypothetical protein